MHSSLAFYSVFRPWSLFTGHWSILFPQNEIFKCVSGQFFKSFLVANSLCGPGSPSHTFPSFPASAVTKTRGNSLSGGVSGTEQWSTAPWCSIGAVEHSEQWSTPSSQICVRTCSLPVCNQFSKYPCTAAPAKRSVQFVSWRTTSNNNRVLCQRLF